MPCSEHVAAPKQARQLRRRCVRHALWSGASPPCMRCNKFSDQIGQIIVSGDLSRGCSCIMSDVSWLMVATRSGRAMAPLRLGRLALVLRLSHASAAGRLEERVVEQPAAAYGLVFFLSSFPFFFFFFPSSSRSLFAPGASRGPCPKSSPAPGPFPERRARGACLTPPPEGILRKQGHVVKNWCGASPPPLPISLSSPARRK